MPRAARDPYERLMERVDQQGEGGCWVYYGTSRKNGYSGVGSPTAKWIYGHRLSYERNKGPIPTGLRIHHECENPLCVNPDHLRAVTASEHAEHHGLGVGPCRSCGADDWFYPQGRARQCRECRRRRREVVKATCPQCGSGVNGESETCSPRCGTLLYNARNPKPEPPHGSYQRYKNRRFRCRCQLCRAANTAYEKARRKTAC